MSCGFATEPFGVEELATADRGKLAATANVALLIRNARRDTALAGLRSGKDAVGGFIIVMEKWFGLARAIPPAAARAAGGVLSATQSTTRREAPGRGECLRHVLRQLRRA